MGLLRSTFALLLAASPALAEDFPGGEATSAEEFEKGFGDTKGITEAEKSVADEDKLKLGGTLASDAYVMSIGSQTYFRNPTTLWMYMDARLRNDIRVYAKGRAVVDSTGSTSNPGLPIPAQKSDVEEMKIFFNAYKTAFFTLGKQKIKWGSAKFWNPTDVVNATPRDLLYSDDRRSGVPLLKTHVPVGDMNFYLVNSFTGATQLNQVGHSLRAEVPLGPSEIALTVSKMYTQQWVFGADVSAGIWDFDVYAEAAYSNGSNTTTYSALGGSKRSGAHVNWTAGLSYELPILDNDSIIFSAEYFRNADGYASKTDYVYPILAGAYVPFHLGQHYAMFSVVAINPGDFNHTTLSLFNVFNITDGSALSKLAASWVLMQDLNFELSGSLHYGDPSGELRYGNQKYDLQARIKVDF